MVEIGLLQIGIGGGHLLKRVICQTFFVPFRQLRQYLLKVADSVGCRCDGVITEIGGLNGRISGDGARCHASAMIHGVVLFFIYPSGYSSGVLAGEIGVSDTDGVSVVYSQQGR